MPMTSEQRRQRARIAVWARGRLADPRTVFLDTETTGLGSGAEIIDVAVVDVQGRVLVDTMIAPLAPIPPETTRIHGLADADVASAPRWPEVYPVLSALLRDRTIVVYNAEFDRRMIEISCAAHGLIAEQCDWHCAMQSYAIYAGERSSHHRSKFRLFKLGDALATFELPAGNHRALGDAMACRSLVLALAGDLGTST